MPNKKVAQLKFRDKNFIPKNSLSSAMCNRVHIAIVLNSATSNNNIKNEESLSSFFSNTCA